MYLCYYPKIQLINVKRLFILINVFELEQIDNLQNINEQ